MNKRRFTFVAKTNEEQKKSAAKFFYDAAKIGLAILLSDGLLKHSIPTCDLGYWAWFTYMFFLTGYIIESKLNQETEKEGR